MLRPVATCVALIGLFAGQVQGHGYMSSPPSRKYAWKEFKPGYFPVFYDYNQNFCGGIGAQFNQKNKGRCGICGDDYSLPIPRPNERGSEHVTGNIVAQYASGSFIDVTITLTANHKGSFTFDLCQSEDPNQLEYEGCFHSLEVYDGGSYRPSFMVYSSKTGEFRVTLYIPEWMTCTYCVLRWKYKTGNNWGCDSTGRCCTGCGTNQEHFYSCADIMISHTGREPEPAWVKIDKSGSQRPMFSTTRPPVPTTRRPYPTTRLPVPTTTRWTTTTTRPQYVEPYVCTQWCDKICRAFQSMCKRLAQMCGKCQIFIEIQNSVYGRK